MKRIWKLQYKFADAIIHCLTWYQYLLYFICFCDFKISYCKKQHMYRFLSVGFINVIYYLLLIIHLALIKHCLGQIWSTPIPYIMTGAADLSWDIISISNQVWNCDGAVLEVLCITSSSDLKRVLGFFKIFNFWNFKTQVSLCTTIFIIISIMKVLLRVYYFISSWTVSIL